MERRKRRFMDAVKKGKREAELLKELSMTEETAERKCDVATPNRIGSSRKK